MEIKVNGESVSVIAAQPSVSDVLVAFGIDPTLNGIAVAVNMEMVPRSLWNATLVADGNELEVITARQGG